MGPQLLRSLSRRCSGGLGLAAVVGLKEFGKDEGLLVVVLPEGTVVGGCPVPPISFGTIIMFSSLDVAL